MRGADNAWRRRVRAREEDGCVLEGESEHSLAKLSKVIRMRMMGVANASAMLLPSAGECLLA